MATTCEVSIYTGNLDSQLQFLCSLSPVETVHHFQYSLPQLTLIYRFHCGQTIGLSTALGVATLLLTWRPLLQRAIPTEVARDSLKIAAFTGSVYWLTGLAAIMFPGSDGLDPEVG